VKKQKPGPEKKLKERVLTGWENANEKMDPGGRYRQPEQMDRCAEVQPGFLREPNQPKIGSK